MKRIIIFLILLSYFPFSYCQIHPYFNAGINYSWFPGPLDSYNIKVDRKYSFSFGAGIKPHLVGNLDLSMGLTYNHYLAHITCSEASSSHQSDYDYDQNLGYLSISILPEYSFGKSKFFFIDGGTCFSALIYSKQNGTAATRVIDGSHSEGNLNRNDFGDYGFFDARISCGAGLRSISCKNLNILPQFRFYQGLINLGSFKLENSSRNLRSCCILIEFDF